MAVVVAGLGVIGVPARPAQADTTNYISVTLDISATFNFGGSNSEILRAIDQAKREILAEIDASEQRILQHIDNTEAAHVAACVRTSSSNLRNLNNFPTRPERNAIAVRATDCANQAGQMSRAVASLSVADYLGFATAEINAIASVLRASAGLDLESQLTGYIGDYERLIDKLRPGCTGVPGRFEEGQQSENVYTCTAYNGDSGSYTQRYYVESGQIFYMDPTVDFVQLQDFAARNTSRRVAKEALPALRQALAMVQRDFVVAAVDLGQTRYWHEDGPLFWNGLGNPGTATALASAIEPSGRRHYLAVIDGRLWHRLRSQDGSWGPWGDQGIAATAVSAAANAQGQVHVTAVINGVTQHRVRVGEGVWTDFQAVPGRAGVATALASTVDPSGRLHLLTIVDGQLGHQLRHPDGSWTGGSWGIAASAVSAAAQADGQVHVAAVIDGQVLHRLRVGEGVWTDFAPVTGLPATSRVTTVTAAIDPAGNYQLAVAVALNGLNDVFLRTRYPSGAWSDPWVRLGTEEDFFLGISAIAAS
jgi:hypothetical protein